jgi:hypothetical protein
MSKSVSNDALWEKLSEISEQLNSRKQAENTPDFSDIKDVIFAEIERQTTKLGKHYDLNHKVNADNWAVTNETVRKILNIVFRIRKQQKETAEQKATSDTEQQSELLETQVNDNREYLNFRFFKLRKTSVVITVLGLLVFILIAFCMKQQNGYSILMNEYYKQAIELREMQTEMDSLTTMKENTIKKK